MVYCGRFGCACCTCQVCFNSKCTCNLKRRAEELLEKLSEDPELDSTDYEIKQFLEDARDESW
jgi:uncharacterized protein YuzB (UPF0349 family)